MASPCKTSRETQVSSPGYMLDTPRLHGGAPGMGPGVPPNAQVPTNSPPQEQEQEQPQPEWPDT